MLTRPVEASTVATSGVVELNVTIPLLSEVGAVSEKSAAPYVTSSMTLDAKVTAPFAMVNVARVVAVSKFGVAGCVAVMEVVPAPTMVMRPVDALTFATDSFVLS